MSGTNVYSAEIQTSKQAFSSSYIWELVNFLICSVGIILLIFILSWLLKKLKLVPNMNLNKSFKIIATLPVGNKERLMVVNVGDEQLLIGVTSTNISLIHKLDGSNKLENAVKDSNNQKIFSEELSKFFRKKQPKDDTKRVSK
ncbi:MAG: flagellar biosynthetic protein FliO [Succinivibrionaceae bacterium]